MARLLITTFNGPGWRTGAAIRFRCALDSSEAQGLLTDVVDEPDPRLGGRTLWEAWPAQLQRVVDIKYIPAAPPDLRAGRLLAFMRFGPKWPQLHSLAEGALLPEWLGKLYEKPVHCWIVGGHHHGHLADANTPPAAAHPRYAAMLWGTHIEGADTLYRPYAGFGLNYRTRELEWFGYRQANRPGEPLVLRFPAVQAPLRHCRLMVILGCNGIPAVFDPRRKIWLWTMGRTWQDWLTDDSGRRPMIAGWFSSKSMPADGDGQNPDRRFATDRFVDKLARLARDLPGDRFLALLDDPAKQGQVVQCWGAACWEAFHDLKGSLGPPYRNLWTECGALARDRTVWHANRKAKAVQKDPPFDLDNTKTLPLMKKEVKFT